MLYEVITVGDEVLRTSEADLRKDGKQAATRFFGPYTVIKLIDENHVMIKPNGAPDSKAERIHMKNLVFSKGKFTVPIYPNQDWAARRNNFV